MTLEEARAKAALLGARIRTNGILSPHLYVRYDWFMTDGPYRESRQWFNTIDEAFRDLIEDIDREKRYPRR